MAETLHSPESETLEVAAPEKPAIERMIELILERRQSALRSRIEAYPRSNPVASDIGACEREMVLAMTHWQERPIVGPDLKARFERGNLLENAVIRELEDMGFTVRVDRKSFEIKDRKGRVILRGKLDGFIEHTRAKRGEQRYFPFEVKSLDPNIFRTIQTVEDFRRYPFTAKYERQLQSYLLSENLECGFFLLDDCLGHWKLIAVQLDYELAEDILRRCEQAVEHRDAGTLPDYIRDSAVCNRCWAFGRACIPPMDYLGLQTIDDEELAGKLDRRAELREVHLEYERIDKEVKEVLKNKTNLVVGNWLIGGKTIKHKGKKAQPPGEYWKCDIEPITEVVEKLVRS